MNDTQPTLGRKHLLVMCAAAAILMITMGMRQSLGLFVAPIIDTTHVGYAAMSFALAIGQLMWGVAQPVFGAMADRHGAQRVLLIGAGLLAAGTFLAPFATNEIGFDITLGVLMAAGAGAGSFGVLIGVVSQRVAPEKRSLAAGFVNAGGSFGQFLFAPLNQALIAAIGWAGALWTMSVAALATIPLARPLLKGSKTPAATPVANAPATMTMRQQLSIAFRDKMEVS